MVKFCQCHIVSTLSLIDQTGQANTKGGFPTVAWKRGRVKGHFSSLRRTHDDVVQRHGLNRDFIHAVLVKELNISASGVIKVTNVADD